LHDSLCEPACPPDPSTATCEIPDGSLAANDTLCEPHNTDPVGQDTPDSDGDEDSDNVTDAE
jgi:hypothetical protein